ncbi:metallophosphoesterase family protein [Paenibacillus dauci]|uniref:metallophosphoesterase family protein n=1 Tax=Paenibacillus dauci TaxID=1567106 RepID=UPI000619CDEA|nr:metallophosphoesterase family protein [Paenibacillus dauci]
MERIALVSDIHGNYPAWQAVLEDIERRGIRRIFCLGDLVGKGPDTVRITDSVRERCEVVIRGNWEELIVRMSGDDELFGWHAQRLGTERLDYLDSLPLRHDFMLSGRLVSLVHASPESVFQRVQPWDLLEQRLAMFAPVPGEETSTPRVPDIVGYGDIHNAYLQYLEGRMLFNTGSVGNPLDLPEASYAILEGDYLSDEKSPYYLQFARVPYDIEQAVADARAAGIPALDCYIKELRTGVYRGLQT